jgi:hypothetical protein
VSGSTAGFGVHKGHRVVPHDHSGQGRDPDGGCWCSGKYLCVTCRAGELPRGVWFWGPECARPKAKAAVKESGR